MKNISKKTIVSCAVALSLVDVSASLTGVDGRARISPEGRMPSRGVELRPGFLKDLYGKVSDHFYFDLSLTNYWSYSNPKKTLDWYQWLPASSEGRMLGTAANLWRWCGDERAKAAMEKIFDGMKRQQRPNGFLGYYPESVYGLRGFDRNTERKNWDRMIWTVGMLLAQEAGVDEAGTVVRRMYDWFDRQPNYLKILFDGQNATNGYVCDPLVALSPVGDERDLQRILKYVDFPDYQELCARGDETLFCAYPKANPHVFVMMPHLSFLLRYKLTGDEKMLAAAKGAWKVYRECYELPGGISAICERGVFPPRSFRLATIETLRLKGGAQYCVGETCGGVLWTWFNALFAELYPDDSRYPEEIEETFVNMLAASRDKNGFVRYHNFPEGVKQHADNRGHCCETTSQLMLSDAPRFLYLEEKDGVRVNQFFASAVSNAFGRLVLDSKFPSEGACRLTVDSARAEPFAVRIRVPTWTSPEVDFFLNGEKASCVRKGSYFELVRAWKSGDVVSWDFPLLERRVKYTGWDQLPGKVRYAHYRGPVVLAKLRDGRFLPYAEVPDGRDFTIFPPEDETP